MRSPKQPKGAIAKTEDVLADGFIQVPQAVLARKDISANAKMLYGMVAGLCRQYGHCFARNEWLAEQFGVYTPAVSKWIKQLQDASLIETIMVSHQYGRERHIYLLRQGLTEGDHTQTDNIQTNTILCNTLDTVGKEQGGDQTQTDKTVISKCVEGSYADAEDGHTQTDTHNIYPEKKTEQNLKREHNGVSASVQVRSEPAAPLSDSDLSTISGKEEAQADQLPAPQARYEGNPRQFLSPTFQKLAEEEKRKRKSKEEAEQQRRNKVHKQKEGSPGLASLGTVVQQLHSVK